MKWTCVTFDCAEPAVVAHFWNEALRWGGVAVSEGGQGAICGPAEGGTYLEFVRVPEGKVVKNRLHLGCSVEALDELDPEIERLKTLGATIAWEEEFPPDVASHYRNVILRDVEDNEFCLGGGELRL
ncbi:MAG: VOC family protein [Actinomycetota bacterium]